LTLEIRQDPDFGAHDAIGQALSRIPEVLEACTITCPGDLWCRVVARSNTDLQRVIDAVLSIPGIFRSSTVIALATQVPYRVQPGRGVLSPLPQDRGGRESERPRRRARRARPDRRWGGWVVR